jgi:hypothetical protein
MSPRGAQCQDRRTDWLTDWLTDRLTDQLTNWLSVAKWLWPVMRQTHTPVREDVLQQIKSQLAWLQLNSGRESQRGSMPRLTDHQLQSNSDWVCLLLHFWFQCILYVSEYFKVTMKMAHIMLQHVIQFLHVCKENLGLFTMKWPS